MNITGGCFCGDIQYEAELDPNSVGLCHCRDCQIFGGSAFRITGIIEPGKFHITQGTPTYFEKTADSGNVRRMGFCSRCGTQLYAEPVDTPNGYVSIRLSTSPDFDKFSPRFETFCRSKPDWLGDIEGTKTFDRMPGDT